MSTGKFQNHLALYCGLVAIVSLREGCHTGHGLKFVIKCSYGLVAEMAKIPPLKYLNTKYR